MNRKKAAVVINDYTRDPNKWHWFNLDDPNPRPYPHGPFDSKQLAINNAELLGYEIETQEAIQAALQESYQRRMRRIH